jgi:hypothetical protein
LPLKKAAPGAAETGAVSVAYRAGIKAVWRDFQEGERGGKRKDMTGYETSAPFCRKSGYIPGGSLIFE